MIAILEVLLGTLCGGGLFAAGAYVGWRAAYAHRDQPAPPVLSAPESEPVILEAVPDWPKKPREDDPVFPA